MPDSDSPDRRQLLDALRALRTLDTNDCPEDLHVLRAELDAVMLEAYDEDPEVVHAGATASAQAGDDVGLREGVLDALADAAKEVIGGHPTRQALPAPTRQALLARSRTRRRWPTTRCSSRGGG